MFSKIWSSTIVLALALNVHAHAIITPALGVSGTPVRGDVQRPSTASPCGTINVASAVGSATPVTAAADGTFTAPITNFNTGVDGSRQVTASVDSTGTGKSFTAATVTTNGDADPTNVGSQPIVASIPAGTKCTGGTSGNVCLFSFKTLGGFGNCVAVQQGASGAATAGNSTAAASNSTAAAATEGAAAGAAAAGTAAATGKATGKAGKAGGAKAHTGKAGAKAGAAKAGAALKAGAAKAKAGAKAAGAKAGLHGTVAGTRAARALLADVEAREAVEIAAREVYGEGVN